MFSQYQIFNDMPLQVRRLARLKWSNKFFTVHVARAKLIIISLRLTRIIQFIPSRYRYDFKCQQLSNYGDHDCWSTTDIHSPRCIWNPLSSAASLYLSMQSPKNVIIIMDATHSRILGDFDHLYRKQHSPRYVYNCIFFRLSQTGALNICE